MENNMYRTYIHKALMYMCIYVCVFIFMHECVYTHEKITSKCMIVKSYLDFEAMFLKYKP